MQKLLTTSAVFFAFFISLSVGQAQGEETKSAAITGKKSKSAVSAKKKKQASAAKKKAKASTPKVKKGKMARKGKKAKKKTRRQLKKEATQAAAEAETQFNDAVKKLESAVPNEVLDAIRKLAHMGKKEAALPLMKLLETGPRSDITDALLFGLGTVGHKDSVPLLIMYLKHRRHDARIAALFALEKFKENEVTEAIENALRDSDRQVRASAALALGKRGSVESVPILYVAFDRGVTDASISIGQLGTPDDAKRLLSYLGKQDIKVLLAGFEEFLHRDDFPENAKLNVLNRLFDLAGPEVWRFAVNFKASFPPDTKEENNKVYKLVCRMVRQIKDK